MTFIQSFLCYSDNSLVLLYIPTFQIIRNFEAVTLGILVKFAFFCYKNRINRAMEPFLQMF